MAYAMKTPYDCQKALRDEIEVIVSDMRFRSHKDGSMIPVSVYLQNLPVPKKGEEEMPESEDRLSYIPGEEEDPIFDCPWCRVMIDSGTANVTDMRQVVEFGVAFGIFNDTDTNEGHQDIMNLIFRVYERFAKDPILAGQYTCQEDFEWKLAEEETYPFFFGVIILKFAFSGLRREMII